jgi:release factor glutamine methyltransferase
VNWESYIKHHAVKISAIFGADASVILLQRVAEHLCQKPFFQIRSENMSEENLIKANDCLNELSHGKPLQYITGECWFYKYAFSVNPSVLIPRPETEELIEWMLQDMNASNTSNQTFRILDIGTGSGCIPITLKKERPQDRIHSIDVSEEALIVARTNAAKLEADVELSYFDILQEERWEWLEKYDYIISNPPYIPRKEKMMLDPQVRDFEPALALFVPDQNPMLFYEKIARLGLTHLLPHGAIYAEVHQDFAAMTKAIFEAAGYQRTEIKNDISGNARMIRAFR